MLHETGIKWGDLDDGSMGECKMPNHRMRRRFMEACEKK